MRRANEKGHVEGLVDFGRANFLVPVPKVASLVELNEEIKRRTRVATLFPNEASLLRLASAVLSEISDDWETERAYLTMEAG